MMSVVLMMMMTMNSFSTVPILCSGGGKVIPLILVQTEFTFNSLSLIYIHRYVLFG